MMVFGRTPTKQQQALRRFYPREKDCFPSKPDLNDNDYLIGRGKGTYNRVGNRKFRALVIMYAENYYYTEGNYNKGMVASAVVRSFRCDGGYFLEKWEDGRFHEIGDIQANKIARDALNYENRKNSRKVLTKTPKKKLQP